METEQYRIPPPDAERSIPELLQRLTTETTLLVRQELQLAQAELAQKWKKVNRSTGFFAAATLLGLGAFGTLTTTFLGALTMAMPLWIAGLIVTVVYGIIAATAAQCGWAAIKKVGLPVPHQTIETLHDDAEALRAGVQRGR